MVNVTLPDDKQNYIHRIGRVGRAERMGLAISLVAKNEEKVRRDYMVPFDHTSSLLCRCGIIRVLIEVKDVTTPASWKMEAVPYGTTRCRFVHTLLTTF